MLLSRLGILTLILGSIITFQEIFQNSVLGILPLHQHHLPRFKYMFWALAKPVLPHKFFRCLNNYFDVSFPFSFILVGNTPSSYDFCLINIFFFTILTDNKSKRQTHEGKKIVETNGHSLRFSTKHDPHSDSNFVRVDARVGQKFIWIFRTSRTVRKPDLEGKQLSNSHPGVSPSSTFMEKPSNKNSISNIGKLA